MKSRSSSCAAGSPSSSACSRMAKRPDCAVKQSNPIPPLACSAAQVSTAANKAAPTSPRAARSVKRGTRSSLGALPSGTDTTRRRASASTAARASDSARFASNSARAAVTLQEGDTDQRKKAKNLILQGRRDNKPWLQRCLEKRKITVQKNLNQVTQGRRMTGG